MNYVFALAAFILLHAPDGREISINAEEVTSIHCKLPGVENKLFAEGINTIINLTDGKHVAVKETCSEVREKLREE